MNKILLQTWCKKLCFHLDQTSHPYNLNGISFKVTKNTISSLPFDKTYQSPDVKRRQVQVNSIILPIKGAKSSNGQKLLV